MKKRPINKKILILALLLALACIGAAELAASRHFAPEVYEQVMTPVRHGARAAADFCVRTAEAAAETAVQAGRALSRQISDASARASALWENLTAPPADIPEDESQLAEGPTLSGGEVTDPAITELRQQDGREILSGGAFPLVYYNQGDPLWSEQRYGSDDIGRYGCGPVAMTMVVDSMAGEAMDPAAMAQWAVDNGFWARRGGSYLSIVEGTAAAFGLTAAPIRERSADAVQEALLAGDLLVALMGPGHFTNGGHFIVLRGVTLSGSILVADPNSLERSLTEWDTELILEELSSSTSDGAPLWVVSRSSPAAE